MTLDKLRALNEAYNPASSQQTAESVAAHHKLALLASHLLLPAMEALEKTATLLAAFPSNDRLSPVRGESTALRHIRAVLAQLEEALKEA